jgi:hypothetical protein
MSGYEQVAPTVRTTNIRRLVEASRVYDVSKITPLSIKNFFSNNYTYGIMSGVGKNTTMKIYIGVRINE